MILSIETSTPACSVALHHEGELVADQNYRLEKSHSGLLPGIIDELLINAGVGRQQLTAVAVTSGPGSYTGLRIGLSTAKGLCYALDLPLIAVGSLETLVEPFFQYYPRAYLAPMLDARRMEVYTMLVDSERRILKPIEPLVLEENSFDEYADQPLVLMGNGATKCKGFIKHPHLIIHDSEAPQARVVGSLAWDKFNKLEFEDVAYFEPEYLKAFQTKKPSNKFKVS